MKETSSIKWLIKNSASQRLKMWVLIISNILFSALSVVFAFAIKGVLDGATSTDKEAGMRILIISGIVLVATVLLQFLFRVLINGLTENIKGKLEMCYKSKLFGEILKKKYDKINVYHSGELMTRLATDVSIVSDGVTSIVPTVVSAVARLLCAVAALIYLDWIFAVAFTIAGIMVFTVIGLLRGKLKSLHKKTQETEGRTRSFMQECIENLLAVKVFSANHKVEDKAEGLQNENFRIKMIRKNYSVIGHAIYNFIFSAGYLFALIYGSVKIFGGDMTYGALSAILQLVNNVQVPFASLSNVVPKFYSMLASAERLMEIETIEDEPIGTVVDRNIMYSTCDGFSVENVSFSYGRDIVLNGCDARIDKGDFVAITGASGIGKSTLMKLMLGVYKPNEGGIYITHNGVKTELDNSTRPLFSYVPQGNLLFSGTLRDNVTFISGDMDDKDINKALEIACANSFIDELPDGLDTVVGEKGIGLSEGQVQRIAIARAILSDAPVILLDEATSALDEETEKSVLLNLKELKDKTLIIISHKKAALSICNKNFQIKSKKINEIKQQN